MQPTPDALHLSGPDLRHRRFAALAARCGEQFDRIGGFAAAGEGLVRDDWARRNRDLAADVLPSPPPDLLRHPLILDEMFADPRHVASELAVVLAGRWPFTAAEEDQVGEPPLLQVDGVVTSANTVHHLHHLCVYEAVSGRRIDDTVRILEWGGGYGNLAKLVMRLHRESPAYVVVDTPVFTVLQWLYLSSTLGEERVRIVTEPDSPLEDGVVHLVPCGTVASMGLQTDLFVSTWGVSQSTARAQQLVRASSWFHAEALLLAMPADDPLHDVVVGEGATSVEVTSSMPDQRYLVR